MNKTSEMNIGEAKDAAINKKRMARAGWNGKGMYVVYVPETYYSSGALFNSVHYDLVDGETLVKLNAHFVIKNVDGSFSTWVPSVNDALAEDWFVV